MRHLKQGLIFFALKACELTLAGVCLYCVYLLYMWGYGLTETPEWVTTATVVAGALAGIAMCFFVSALAGYVTSCWIIKNWEWAGRLTARNGGEG